MGLDLVSGSLVVIHTYLCYFPSSLSLCRASYASAVGIAAGSGVSVINDTSVSLGHHSGWAR